MKFKKGHKKIENSFGKGWKHTDESKKKLSLSHKGKKPWLGKHHTEETKNKIRLFNIGRKNTEESKDKIRGKNNINWQGGKSSEEYGVDWTDSLRKSIRERDSYVCQKCGIHQSELDKKLDVHHIDYNKLNLDPKNLITLCRFCHLKTNLNREYWINYFNNN
jgi:5-methylcytosine-specific restriction endonuclease McrA